MVYPSPSIEAETARYLVSQSPLQMGLSTWPRYSQSNALSWISNWELRNKQRPWSIITDSNRDGGSNIQLLASAVATVPVVASSSQCHQQCHCTFTPLGWQQRCPLQTGSTPKFWLWVLAHNLKPGSPALPATLWANQRVCNTNYFIYKIVH